MLTFLRKQKQSIIMYVMLFAALLSMAFFGLFNLNTGKVSGLLAKVGDYSISMRDFKRVYQQQEWRYKQYFKDKFNENYRNMLLSRVQSQLVYSLVQRIEADRIGLGVSEKEVKSEIKEIPFFVNNGKFDFNKFSDYLRREGYSESSFLDHMHATMLNQKFESILSENIFISENDAFLAYKMENDKVNVRFVSIDANQLPYTPTEKEKKDFLKDGEEKVQRYYDSHKLQYNEEKKVKASHILIAYKGSQRAAKEITRTKEEAKKKAEEILIEVKKKSSDFVKLANKYTDEASGKKKGGDLGFFSQKDMVKPFSDAAFKLKKGGISSVVETPFGFHIIKVTDIKKAVTKSYSSVKREIIDQLIFDEKKDKLAFDLATDLIAKLNKKEKVEKLLKKNQLKTQETGLFTVNEYYVKGLGSEDSLKEAAFSLKKKDQVYSKPLRLQGKYYVLQLIDKVHIKKEDFKKEKDNFIQKLSTERIGHINSKLRNGLMDQYKDRIVIYKTVGGNNSKSGQPKK